MCCKYKEKWWRVHYIGYEEYLVQKYDGCVCHITDLHWSFFTWSDGSKSNDITLPAISELDALDKAKAIYNPCKVSIDEN